MPEVQFPLVSPSRRCNCVWINGQKNWPEFWLRPGRGSVLFLRESENLLFSLVAKRFFKELFDSVQTIFQFAQSFVQRRRLLNVLN